MARRTWRGASRSGASARARAFHVLPGSSSSWFPASQLLEPRRLDRGDLVLAILGRVARGVPVQRFEELACDGARIAADGDVDGLCEPEHVRIGIDLDDPRLSGPVLDGVLRERAERIEARAEREDDIRLLDQDHRRLPALVAQWPDSERVARGKAVVVEVAVRDGGPQALGEHAALVDRIAQHHAGSRHDDGKFRLFQHPGGVADRVHVSGLASRQNRFGNVDVDDLAEIVSGDVELHGRRVLPRALEAPGQRFDHAVRMRERFLMAGNLLEVRELAGLLESPEPLRLCTRLGRDDEHRGVVPVRCGNCGDEVGDTGTILRDAHCDFAVRPSISVRHVRRPLLVRDVDESDSRAFEHVESRHERGTDDSECDLHSVHAERFDERLLRCHLHRFGSPLNALKKRTSLADFQACGHCA